MSTSEDINSRLMWMPVAEETKPNDDLGGATSYKEKYCSMKNELKHILYQNEVYHDKLIRLKRELLDIYSDKDTLLNRIIESGVDLGVSDDDEDEHDEMSQFSDIAMPAKSNNSHNIHTHAHNSNNNQTDSDATSRIITLNAAPVATISTTMTTAGMPTIVMTSAKTPGPTTTTATSLEGNAATTTTTTTTAAAASKANATVANGRAKPKAPTGGKSRAKATPTAGKAAVTKAVATKGAATSKAAAVKANKTTAIKSDVEPTTTAETSAPITTTSGGPAATDGDEGAAKPKPKRKRPSAPKKTAAEKKAELEQQQQQQQTVDNQSGQQESPLTAEEATKAKPAAPKRQRKPPTKKPKLAPATQAAAATGQQQQQDMQHSPMTVMGQVQVQVSQPNEQQMKFVQHVNLPEQNLVNNGNMIITNHGANHIQVQQLQHFHQNHHRQQQDNNNHQIQLQMPQTTTSTMESFQTPQSIITTSQGGHLGYGQHQSYTIVATNGNLIQHDLNQQQNHSPPVQMTQAMSMGQAMQNNNNNNNNRSISNQTIRGSNMQTHQTIQGQGMPTQEIQTISFQQIQPNSNVQQQQGQQQQQDDNNYGAHQIIQFELPQQIQLSQVQQHPQQIHHQLQMQPQQQQQQMQMQQMTPVRGTVQVASDDLEQHLEGRRLEQQAAALLMPDWESSVPSELFGSDSAIKFMAED